MTEPIFKKEVDDFMENLYNIQFDNSLTTEQQHNKIKAELEKLLETIDEDSRNYVIEHRGDFGLRSESDTPIGT